MGEFSFPRAQRLRTSEQYRRVYEEGRKVRAYPVLAFVLPNGLEHNRLGMAVSRKVGKAHRRNRIKRLFREGFRLTRDVPTGFDIVLIPMDRAKEYRLGDVTAALPRLLDQAKRPPGKPNRSGKGPKP